MNDKRFPLVIVLIDAREDETDSRECQEIGLTCA